MERILTILEVSQKQAYIFGSKRLKDNAARSWEISYVTSPGFFETAAGELYHADNFVYSGGGHTVLQFPSRDAAVTFTKKVTEAAIRQFNGLELFAAHLEYDAGKSPGDNLEALSQALERKKALRKTSFRQLNFGMEELDAESLRPKPLERGDKREQPREPVDPPDGWEFPAVFEKLAGNDRNDNFIAVVHIDGNSMGKRVEHIYKKQNSGDWDVCRESLKGFSNGIQKDFEDAFQETVLAVIERLRIPPGLLPIRPVILAGDDVCFVTSGKIGLECARLCLEKLAGKTNQEDGQPYAACAGVALVHVKFPFHQAYELSEELCSNAKRFGAGLDGGGGVSAMDWHIEFGQLKDSLSELRRDYETEDGNRLELRPVTVWTPGGGDSGVRDYRFFQNLCRSIQENRDEIARGKLKEFRTAMKQGVLESEYYLHDAKIVQLLDKAFPAEHHDWLKRRVGQWQDKLSGVSVDLSKSAFRAFSEPGGKKILRCLYFDAIELADHWTSLEEVEA